MRLAKQSQFIALQNVVYFITLPFSVRKIFTFYITYVLLFRCPFPGPKGLRDSALCRSAAFSWVGDCKRPCAKLDLPSDGTPRRSMLIARYLLWHIIIDRLAVMLRSMLNMYGQFVWFWRDSPQWVRASSFTRFLEHTQTTHNNLWNSSERVISSSQRSLPDNTQHSQ